MLNIFIRIAGEQSPLLDCVAAQIDLNLRIKHMHEDMFSQIRSNDLFQGVALYRET